jgi:hypothetical protein
MASAMGGEGDGCLLPTFARDGEHPVPALGAELIDVCPEGFGDAQPVQSEQEHEGAFHSVISDLHVPNH